MPSAIAPRTLRCSRAASGTGLVLAMLLVSASCASSAPKGAEDPTHETGGNADGASPVDSAPPDSGEAEDSRPDIELPDPDIDVGIEPDPDGTVRCAAPTERAEQGPVYWVEDPEGFAALDDFPGGAAGPPGSTMSIGVGDIDGDGVRDVVFGRPDGVRLFLGLGDGRFRPAPEGAWPEAVDISLHVSGVVLVDTDEDGDLDVIVVYRSRPPRRFTNDGSGVFTGHDELGPGDGVTAHIGPSMADLDGDGQLELLVGGHQAVPFTAADPPPPMEAALYTLSEGVLAPSPHVLPPMAHVGYTFMTTLVDLDMDGRTDAYLANDHGLFGGPNRVLWNRESDGDMRLEDGSGRSGLQVVMAGMGIAVGDVNLDGHPDLALSNWGPPSLFLSDTIGGWYDAALVRGVVDTEEASVGWGTEFGDLDNDGDLDLAMVFGWLPGDREAEEPNEREQPDKLFLNDGTGHFTEVAAEWGVADPDINRSSLLVDLNGDGFLDQIIAPQFAPPKVWMSRCDDSAWLEIDLEQPPPNRDAVGAIVQVVDGDQVWTRWLFASGRSFGSSAPLEAHFGLGSRDRVERVLVTWPDGSVSESRDVETRRRVLIRRE